MSDPRIRVEVTDQHGTVAGIFTPPAQSDLAVDALAGQLVADLAAILGCGEDHARQVAIAVLMRLQADEAAYERVAESRGFLPL